MSERDDGLKPLGEGTEDFLQDAKKGKPRSFLLVCKGAKVSYVVVRKKPVKQKDLVEAKKQGYKGEGYFGLITGKGMELVFNLARSDGYDSEPVKDKALKEFLEEHAQFKCKPSFAITDFPPCAFGEEELQIPAVARFMQLEPQALAATRTYPGRSTEILARTNEVRELLIDENYDAVAQRLDGLEQFLLALPTSDSGAASPAESAQPDAGNSSMHDAPPDAPTVAPPEDLAKKFKQRLSELKPTIDTAMAGNTAAQDIKSQLATIVNLARQQDFAQSLQLLEQLATTLPTSQVPPPPPPPLSSQSQSPTPTEDPARSFMARLKLLKPQIDQRMQGPPAVAANVKALAGQAATAARSKDFVAANAALDQLEQLFQSLQNQGNDQSASAPVQPSVDPAVAFVARLKALKPQLDKALASPLPLAADIKLRTGEAAAFARQKDFAAANQTLDTLEELLKRLATTDPNTTTSSRVSPDELLGLWRDAKDAVDEQLNSFVKALKETGDEYLVRVAGRGLQGFVEGPTRIFVSLQAALFDLKKASADTQPAAIARLISAIASATEFISQNRFIEVCDANVLCGPLTIRKTLLDSLKRLGDDAAKLAV